ncbi:MAG TPA: peptidylprolyl isomerase [Candidatus Binatia bacterium]|nr:peptidylprolyl isomerase [Candidatus Binatia bacterium]
MARTKKSNVKKRRSYNRLFLVIALIIIIVAAIGVYFATNQGTPATFPPTKVLLQTTAGNITIDLRTDKPITSGNFANLVKEGKYDGTIFHRVIEGFMIQGGQVNSSVPTIKDEIGSNNHNLNNTIAMAKTSEPNSATSEFFINVADNGNLVVDQAGTKFDAVYAVFGTIISGQDVVHTIAKAPVMQNPYTHENSSPVNPVTVIKATILP